MQRKYFYGTPIRLCSNDKRPPYSLRLYKVVFWQNETWACFENGWCEKENENCVVWDEEKRIDRLCYITWYTEWMSICSSLLHRYHFVIGLKYNQPAITKTNRPVVSPSHDKRLTLLLSLSPKSSYVTWASTSGKEKTFATSSRS